MSPLAWGVSLVGGVGLSMLKQHTYAQSKCTSVNSYSYIPGVNEVLKKYLCGGSSVREVLL